MLTVQIAIMGAIASGRQQELDPQKGRGGGRRTGCGAVGVGALYEEDQVWHLKKGTVSDQESLPFHAVLLSRHPGGQVLDALAELLEEEVDVPGVGQRVVGRQVDCKDTGPTTVCRGTWVPHAVATC